MGGMTLRIAIVVVVMAALAGAWWLLQILGIPADLSPDALAQWLKSQGAAGPLLLMLLMTMAVTGRVAKYRYFFVLVRWEGQVGG